MVHCGITSAVFFDPSSLKVAFFQVSSLNARNKSSRSTYQLHLSLPYAFNTSVQHVQRFLAPCICDWRVTSGAKPYFGVSVVLESEGMMKVKQVETPSIAKFISVVSLAVLHICSWDIHF